MANKYNNRYNKRFNKSGNRNYNNNNGFNRYDNRQHEQPANKKLSLTQFQNNTLEIEDINGKTYVINMNLPNEVIDCMVKVQSKFKNISKSENGEQFSEVYDGLKDIILAVMNNNPDGTIYKWDEIKSGFDNIFAMNYMISAILNEYTRYANVMKANA